MAAAEGANRIDLEGRTCVVTGGARGIGNGVATALTAAGAKVALLDIDAETLAAAAAELGSDGAPAPAVEVDVRDSASVAAAFEQVDERLGKVDVLVNSAGVREISGPLELPEADWERVVGINLSGTFYCAQQAGRRMVAAGSGSIVNIASVAGLHGFPSRVAYCSSKFGIVGLTHSMAADLGPHGVRINAICPGLIRTPMTEPYFADEGLIGALPKVIPLGGAGTPEHIANAALFLASSMSEYVTGVALPVDGGFLAARSFDARLEDEGGAFLSANVID